MAIKEKGTIIGTIARPSLSLLKMIKRKEMAEMHRGRKNGSENILQYGHVSNRPLISEMRFTKRPRPRKDRAGFFLDKE